MIGWNNYSELIFLLPCRSVEFRISPDFQLVGVLWALSARDQWRGLDETAAVPEELSSSSSVAGETHRRQDREPFLVVNTNDSSVE
jgi:hypothetical protein